jgi:hypothetical protein
MACGSSLARCLKFFFVGGDGACSRWWLPWRGRDDVARGEVFPSVKNQGYRTRRRITQWWRLEAPSLCWWFPRRGEDDVASREVFPLAKDQGYRTRRRFSQHHVFSTCTQENKSPHSNTIKGLSSP